MDSRSYGVRDYSRIYRVLGNIGAVGSAIFANRYQASEPKLGGKTYSIRFPKKYKKDWEKFMYTPAKRRGYKLPATPRSLPRARMLSLGRAKQRLRLSAKRRIQGNVVKISNVRKMVSGNNKYLPSNRGLVGAVKQIVKKSSQPTTTGGQYAGSTGRTYRLKKSKEFQILLKGAITNKDFSGISTTAQETVYVGHANYSFGLMLRTFSRALVKMLINRVGVNIEKFDDNIPGGMVGDLVQIRYKTLYLAGSPLNTNLPLGAGTWESLVSLVVGHLISQTSQYQMIDITYNPAGGSAFKFYRLHMKNAKVYVHSNSEFTIQNRTLSGLDNKAQDNVDNQPIKVKVYFGKGNGTQIANTQGGTVKEYVAGENTGVIDVIPNTQNDQQEPPNARFFAQCTREGTFYLDPGQSKKSHIYHGQWMTITSYIQKVLFGNLGDWSSTLMKLGKHKIFACEKIIDCVQAQPDIVVGFEHNLKIGVMIKPGFNRYTAPYFDKDWKV